MRRGSSFELEGFRGREIGPTVEPTVIPYGIAAGPQSQYAMRGSYPEELPYGGVYGVLQDEEYFPMPDANKMQVFQGKVTVGDEQEERIRFDNLVATARADLATLMSSINARAARGVDTDQQWRQLVTLAEGAGELEGRLAALEGMGRSQVRKERLAMINAALVEWRSQATRLLRR